jgi:hypothetical protein
MKELQMGRGTVLKTPMNSTMLINSTMGLFHAAKFQTVVFFKWDI